MDLLKKIGCLLILSISFSTAAIAQTAPLASDNLSAMLKRVTPTIVNISVKKDINKVIEQMPKDRPITPQRILPHLSAVGSGIIIDAQKGYIATNAHVIKDAKTIIITLKNGEKYLGTPIGQDTGFDVAVIQIKAENLSALPYANSNNQKVGEVVAAIGSPFGLQQTVTSGVISALNRDTPQIEGFQSFIQTDAPINPGNSGGALVNKQGQLVGMNTALIAPIDANIGIGFAIPSNMVKSICDQLIKYGKVERGMLGVMAQNLTPDLIKSLNLKQDHGVIITQVVPNSPAKKAGLETDDIIISVNGDQVRNAQQLQNTMALTRPGTKITMTVITKDKTHRLTATVADPKKAKTERIIPFLSGIRLQDFNELEDTGMNVKGIIITAMKDNSSAAMAGLQPGDVIISVNNQATPNLIAFRQAIKNQKSNLLLKISRDNSTLYIVLKPFA